jgi:TATA-box binding protein (TBP) (component of TFIID and TFIIIB)
MKKESHKNGLPDGLNISTITVSCSFDTNFYVKNIGKYMPLSKLGISTVKYGKHFRTILTEKELPKKYKNYANKKSGQKHFYNQTTVLIHNLNGKPINVKLFRNGAVQMTGCKSKEDSIVVLEKICHEIRRKIYVIDEQNGTKRKIFVSNKSLVKMSKVENYKIAMINSNFKLNYHMDCKILFNLLINKGIECIYEPCHHAPVNIKYNHKDRKKISIFVFEKGSIIITGANTIHQVLRAYIWINELLQKHHDVILLKNISITNPKILALLGNDSIKKFNEDAEIKHKPKRKHKRKRMT